MNLPTIVDHDQWLAARKALLASEKDHQRRTDALNTQRRNLPMVRIAKDYRFTGPDGPVPLLDLFGPHRQLIVQHFMFDPAWDGPCGSCTAMAAEMSDGVQAQLAKRDTAFAAVSRAPYPKLDSTRRDRGWTFPWYSSYGTDFNHDFQVTLDPAAGPARYNFRDAEELAASGLLDITALGRQEDWEEPRGRAPLARPADPSFSR